VNGRRGLLVLVLALRAQDNSNRHSTVVSEPIQDTSSPKYSMINFLWLTIFRISNICTLNIGKWVLVFGNLVFWILSTVVRINCRTYRRRSGA